MNHLAQLLDYSWSERETRSVNKPKSYRLRVKNQSPVVTVLKLLLVLGMGLGALVRFIIELTQSVP